MHMDHSPSRVGWLRFFGRPCLLMIILLTHAVRAQDVEMIVYVGTYTGNGSDGIYAFRFDSATGESHVIGLAAPTKNPSFLAIDPDGRFLYAVNEVDAFENVPTGAVTVFAIDAASGVLKPLQQVSSLGRGPAHLSLDRTARFLMVANYGGGNVAVFPIGRDGRLGNRTAFMQGHGSSVNRERQEAPHAHAIQVTPDNRRAIVADLGIDKLLVYGFNDKAGTLTADSARNVRVVPGSGPRHIAMTPSGSYLYLVNELTSSVTLFAFNAAEGSLQMKQTLSTLPDGFEGTNTAAGIVVDAKGRFLYVSNRGDDSIVVFSIDPGSARLTLVQRIPSGGKTPRHIALDPTGGWLLSANQNSDLISLFRVDPGNGRLTTTSHSLRVVSPVCVAFAH